MPKWPAFERQATTARRVAFISAAVFLVCGNSSCHRDHGASAAKEQRQDPRNPPPQRLTKHQVWNKGQPREVFATWYEVPDESLAKRRASPDEFTAAHNRLPIGTPVRVTHLKNGKSVVVRITDRGIGDRRVKLDLCKEAAEELGMVSKGLARVRMQVLEEGASSSSSAAGTAASLP